MKRRLALLGVVVLAACGKASEKAAEKMIESSIAKDGTQTKVNLSEGGMKVTTTDASGKTTQMEMGNPKISEADLGLPFYPGAKPTEGSSMRIVNGASMSLQQGLHSDDAPDKVAAFYRDKLKAQSQGKQFIDMSDGSGGAAISLVDAKANSSIQVHVQLLLHPRALRSPAFPAFWHAVRYVQSKRWVIDRYEIGTGFGHVAIEVPDAKAACDAVRAKGGSVTREAGPVKGGATVIAFVQDPDGYKIELIERAPRK